MRRWALLLFPVFGCGPSFQAVYTGEARFEHCYSMEERPEIAIDDKRECWREWTLRYTYAQTRDRVEYAVSRFKALSQLPDTPTDEAMMQGAPGEGERLKVALPAPTNAFAPPVSTMPDACIEACNKDESACSQRPSCKELAIACRTKCGK